MIPRNEMEVVVLFSQQAQAAGFEIISVQAEFPDAITKRDGIEYRVEFEYRASNFLAHRHDPDKCDLIICWVNDEEYPPLPTIELSNPDWTNISISSLPHRQNLVGYWKKRSMIVEERLRGAEELMPKVIEAMIQLLYIAPRTENLDEQALVLQEAISWQSLNKTARRDKEAVSNIPERRLKVANG